MAIKKQSYTPPPKPLKIEVRVFISILYQAKHKLEIKKWMKNHYIFEAHPMLFKRTQDAIYRDYGMEITVQDMLKSIDILMEGFNQDDIL